MFMEELLEMVIGMIVVWLGIAIAIMGVQEWLAGIFKFRSKDLEKAIRGMLEDPTEVKGWIRRFLDWIRGIAPQQASAGPSLVDQFYEHPLIQALSEPGKPKKKPSYIPDRTFALALFDVVTTAGTDGSVVKKQLQAWKDELDDKKNLSDQAKQAVAYALPQLDQLLGQALDKPSFLAAWKARVEDIKKSVESQLPPKDYAALEPFLDELARGDILKWIVLEGAEYVVDNEQIQGILNSLITGAEFYVSQAEQTLAAARTNVENWFNDTMDRASGWYKRRAQLIGATLGIAFAVVLNVDSMTIATTLWREPAVRDALVATAEQFQLPEGAQEGGVDPATAIKQFNEGFEGLHLPIGWMSIKVQEGQCWGSWESVDSEGRKVNGWGIPIDSEGDKVVGWGIPIGGECIVPVDTPEGMPWSWSFWALKISGFVLSGLAGSLGAPFWFDVLKKVTNVRAAGIKPAEVPTAKG